MSEKETQNLFHGITYISDDIIEEARPRRKQSGWVKWGAAAACLCLVTVGVVLLAGRNAPHTLQMWSENFQAGDYFRYSSSGTDGAASSPSLDISSLPYAETRYFSDGRETLEAEGVIPAMDSHPLFTCAAHYNDDGSLYSLEFSWHRRGELSDYSDLTITAGYQEVEQIKDYITIEVDENGNVVEPAVTVTERDGVRIVAEGRENREKTITFQNGSGWYQIAGSWNDSYAAVAELLDWLWEHPIDFTQFPLDAGDEYTFCPLEEYPDAFSGYLPDFAAFGFIEEVTFVSLKNGVPVRFEGHYVAHVDEVYVKALDYYDVEGYTTMHWCLETEPDVYDLERCAGSLEELTEEIVTGVLAEENSVSFTWDGFCVTVYPTLAQEAWDLIDSLRAG